MTSAGVVCSKGERLRTAAVRLAIAGGLAAAAWLAGAVAAHADEAPARADVLSPSTDSEYQEPAKADAVTRAGGLGERIAERVAAKLGKTTALRGGAAGLAEDDEGLRDSASGGGMVTTGSDVVQPLPEEDESAAPVRPIRTAKSAEGSASAVRAPKPPPPPPPAEEPAPAPVDPVVVQPPQAEPAPAAVLTARPHTASRVLAPVLEQPRDTDRSKREDIPDLPGPDPRQPTPGAPSSASLGGTASDNSGARGATALVTAPMPQLPKPSLVTVERPRNAGSPHSNPGLPATSPD